MPTMVPMAMVLVLVPMAMLAMPLPPTPMLLPTLPATERPTPLTLLALLDSPLLPPPVWSEAMLLLADMLPTLLESSTSPRGPLMLSPRLRPTTVLMVILVLDMVDTAMVPTPMLVLAMDMVDMLLPMPTTERGPLMLSLRLRLMLTMAMLDTAMVPTPMLDTDTLLPMPMVPMPTERGLLMPSPRLMPTMELTDMLVLAMLDMAIPVPTAMVPTPMPMVMASKMSSASV